MSNIVEKFPSPWLSIWLQPRQTMRRIAQRDPDELIILLVSFGGFSEILANASRFNLGDQISIPLIFAMAVIMGPIIGITGMFIATLLLHWTGKWLDGKSSFAMIRAAIAWSFVPIIFFSILWIPQYILLGDVLFESRVVIYGSKAHLIIVVLNVLRLVIVIWSIVIFLNCLCEIQKFPVWKAIINCFLSTIIFGIGVLFIAAVVAVVAK